MTIVGAPTWTASASTWRSLSLSGIASTSAGGGCTSALGSDEGLDRLGELLATYFERGGMQVQLNAVSREQLIEAQAHPEASPPIVVRVTGFSADFLTLSRTVQDEIIRRTEHSLRT